MVDPTNPEISSERIGLIIKIAILIVIFSLVFFIMREKFWEPLFG